MFCLELDNMLWSNILNTTHSSAARAHALPKVLNYKNLTEDAAEMKIKGLIKSLRCDQL